MIDTNPLLMLDFYKVCHQNQYNPEVTKLVAYYIPRLDRLHDHDGKVTFFGLQAFIKEYLIDYFNKNFFERPEDEVAEEYNRVLAATLGAGAFNDKRLRELHRLGYLPLCISALTEGTRSAIGVPQIEITNTHPEFAWVVNTIESVLSCYMWHIQTSAEVGYKYRQIADRWANLTCDDDVDPRRLLSDFSMRGQHSPESAIKSSAAWCLSFLGTATVPAITWLEKNYDCDCTKEPVAFGAVSTEHSVMCSNYAIDGDEITFLKKLLTEIYPNNSFSVVSDSYDYWNLVDNILPQIKDEILNHNGTMLIRGDSGNPVEVVTETVFHLWDIFGGTVNSKGFKVLNSHVKAIYGDSITPIYAEKIYQILSDNGFAANNVALGVGSLSMMANIRENEDGSIRIGAYTRDTFGVAIKVTYGEINGQPLMIYKDPKALSWKKSPRGCCIVTSPTEFTDGHTWEEVTEAEWNETNRLMPVFRDGRLIRTYTLAEIRRRMYH